MCGPRFLAGQEPDSLSRCAFNAAVKLIDPALIFDRLSAGSDVGFASALFLRRFSVPIILRQKRETVFQDAFTLSFCSNSLMVSNEAPFCRNATISSLYFINSRNSFGVRSYSCAASRNDCLVGWLASITSKRFWPGCGQVMSQRCPNLVQPLSG